MSDVVMVTMVFDSYTGLSMEASKVTWPKFRQWSAIYGEKECDGIRTKDGQETIAVTWLEMKQRTPD